MDTIYKCGKCGATTTERGGGWLIGSHKAGKGRMVIRCPKCATKSAARNVKK